MFVQMICKDRNEKEMNELYEVLGLIARREEVQIGLSTRKDCCDRRRW